MQYKGYELPHIFDPKKILDAVERGQAACTRIESCANIKYCDNCLFRNNSRHRKALCKEWVKTKEFLARLL